jgi:hypothetical protein
VLSQDTNKERLYHTWRVCWHVFWAAGLAKKMRVGSDGVVEQCIACSEGPPEAVCFPETKVCPPTFAGGAEALCVGGVVLKGKP